jgi:hypothetical protein
MTYVSLSVALRRSLSWTLPHIVDAVLIIILVENIGCELRGTIDMTCFTSGYVTDTLFAFLIGSVDVALR